MYEPPLPLPLCVELVEAGHAEDARELHAARVEAKPALPIAAATRTHLDHRAGAVEYVMPGNTQAVPCVNK